MKIETKFNVGDAVYVCRNDSTYEEEQCKICEGTGNVILKGKSFCCPECQGNKFTYTKKVRRFTPEIRTIRKVIVSISNSNGNIQVHTRYETKLNHHGSIAEYRNIMFATEEEAEYRCKELNGEIIKVPNAMMIKEFADRIKVSPSEIIKWLFLRGKAVSNNSLIRFDDMKEFADGYGFICEKEVEE